MTAEWKERLKRWGAIAAISAVALWLFQFGGADAIAQERTTICHPVASATGGNTGAGYSEITTANPSAHIDEATGAPKHEHDGRVDFVVDAEHPCPPQGEPEPELVAYKVVAGMPRYRGDVFYDEAGLTCKLAVNMARRTWTAYCGDHVDKGRLNARYRTYVRLRVVGEPGPAQVLLDLR